MSSRHSGRSAAGGPSRRRPDSSSSGLPFDELRSEWPQEPRQQRLAACETLLLCMPLEVTSLGAREQSTLRAVVQQLLEPEGPTIEELASSLRIDGAGVGDEVRPFLHYRLLLLLQKQPHAFAHPRAFVEWATRQLNVLANGLAGALRTSRHQPHQPRAAGGGRCGDTS